MIEVKLMTWSIDYYYTLDIFGLYKSNKTILMFYGKFADERDTPVENSNIYAEEDNRLSSGL